MNHPETQEAIMASTIKLDDVLNFDLSGYTLTTSGRLRPHGANKEGGGGPSKAFTLNLPCDRMTVNELLAIAAEACKIKWQNKVRGDFATLEDGTEHRVPVRDLGMKTAVVTKEAALATLRAKIAAGEMTQDEAVAMLMG